MPELLAMLACVIAILALAYYATRLLGKYGASALPGRLQMGEISVLRQIPVGRAERLVLVRVHQKCLLLGVAQGGVSVLCELTAEDSEKWLRPPEPAEGMDFLSALRKTVGKKEK